MSSMFLPFGRFRDSEVYDHVVESAKSRSEGMGASMNDREGLGFRASAIHGCMGAVS